MWAWIILIVSGVFEAVWATALGKSEGFSKPVPTVVFGVGLVLSMIGLAVAMRDIPTGTAYAVWVGVGAVGTAILGIVLLGEPANPGRLISLGLIVAGIIGLKLATVAPAAKVASGG